MSESRLQRWALLAEVAGGIAVVVTLGFLAFQMRANTDAIQAQTYQSMMVELNTYRRSLQSFEMAELMNKYAAVGWAGLTEDEKRVRWSISATRWGIYESAYFANQRGVIGGREWTRFEEAFCRGYETEGDIWRATEFTANGMVSFLTPEFADYVETSCG